jgi:hypothetical protein
MRDQERGPELAGSKSRMMAELPSSLYVLATHLTAVLLRAGVADHVTLPVQAANEHGPPMLVTTRLICADEWRLIASGRDVSQAFAKTALAELSRTPEKFN